MNFGPPLARAFLKAISDNDIKKIGEEQGKIHPGQVLAALGLPINLNNKIRFVDEIQSRYTHWYESTIDEMDDNTLRVYLVHNLNRKWSLFLDAYMRSMFQKTRLRATDVQISDSTVTLYFTRPESKVYLS